MYYEPNVQWVDVEEWLYGEEAEGSVLQQRAEKFWTMAMCLQDGGHQETQLQLLRDLSAIIRAMRDENQASYSNTHDNWSNLIGFSPALGYLTYIYSLVSLVVLPEHVLQAAPQQLNENINMQLALNAATTYLLTLTIPGAKIFGVFDEDVIEQVLKVFRLLEMNNNKSLRASMIWMFFLTICDDLKIVFRYVHFKEHLKTRDRIIRCLLEVLYMNFKMGYQNTCKCNPLCYTYLVTLNLRPNEGKISRLLLTIFWRQNY